MWFTFLFKGRTEAFICLNNGISWIKHFGYQFCILIVMFVASLFILKFIESFIWLNKEILWIEKKVSKTFLRINCDVCGIILLSKEYLKLHLDSLNKTRCRTHFCMLILMFMVITRKKSHNCNVCGFTYQLAKYRALHLTCMHKL